MSTCSSCLPLRSLNHISRVCKNVEVTAKFYEEILGFYKVKRPSSFDFDGYWLFNYNIGIHLIAGEPLARPREINPRGDHLSFQADNLSEVEERLKALGIQTVKATVEENGICITQVFFNDPDGNMIEICDCDCFPVQPLARAIPQYVCPPSQCCPPQCWATPHMGSRGSLESQSSVSSVTSRQYVK